MRSSSTNVVHQNADRGDTKDMITCGSAQRGLKWEKNIQQAKYLASLAEKEPELELAAPASLSTVCFRYKPHRLHDLTEIEIDRVNKAILTSLHTSGTAVPTHTVLNGRFVLRVAITNHRTRVADLEFLVREVLLLGRKIVGRSAGVTLG
jgi:glutamate/tyrosine decarboxylase-like PLP-dependent enzyme